MTHSRYMWDTNHLPGLLWEKNYANELIGCCSIDPTGAGIVTDYSKPWAVDQFATGYTLYVLTGDAFGEFRDIIADVGANAYSVKILTAITGFVKGDWFRIVPDTKEVAVPVPVEMDKIGAKPDWKREGRKCIGGGKYANGITQNLETNSNPISGKYMCENIFNNFDNAMFGSYVDYYDNGRLRQYPTTICTQAYTMTVGGVLTDVTDKFNNVDVTNFNILEDGETGAAFLIGFCDIADAIYFCFATKGIVGTVDYFFGGGAGTIGGMLQLVTTDGTTVGGADFAKNGIVSWIPPTSWVRERYTAGAVVTKYLYWIKVMVNDAYTVDPIADYGKVRYPPHSLTLEQPVDKGIFSEWDILTGMIPSKSTLSLEKDTHVKIDYDIISKNYIMSLVNTSDLPDQDQFYDFSPLDSAGNVSIAFTNTLGVTILTDYATNIRSLKRTLDPKREGTFNLGRDYGINGALHGSIDCEINLEVNEVDYSFKKQFLHKPNVADSKINMTLIIRDDEYIETPKVAGFDPTAYTFTFLTQANSDKLHVGDVIVIKETVGADKERVNIVTSINEGTGVVSCYKTLGGTPAVMFTTACKIYLCKYRKEVYSSLQIKSTDNFDNTITSGEMVHTYTLIPTALTTAGGLENVEFYFLPSDVS